MGSNQIGQLYAGGVEIAQAYLGSDKVFERQAPTLYDFKLELLANVEQATTNMTMYSLLVGGVAPVITSAEYSDYLPQGWRSMSSSDCDKAIGTSPPCLELWSVGIRFYFTSNLSRPSISFKCGKYWAPSLSITASLYTRASGSSDPWTYVQNSRTTYSQSADSQIYV